MTPLANPAAIEAHRRLSLLLPTSVHTLLRAHEPVEDPEPPPPRVQKPRKINPEPNRKSDSAKICAIVLRVLTDKAVPYQAISAITELHHYQVRKALSRLIEQGKAQNTSQIGAPGAYRLPQAPVAMRQKGPFDV